MGEEVYVYDKKNSFAYTIVGLNLKKSILICTVVVYKKTVWESKVYIMLFIYVYTYMYGCMFGIVAIVMKGMVLLEKKELNYTWNSE